MGGRAPSAGSPWHPDPVSLPPYVRVGDRDTGPRGTTHPCTSVVPPPPSAAGRAHTHTHTHGRSRTGTAGSPGKSKAATAASSPSIRSAYCRRGTGSQVSQPASASRSHGSRHVPAGRAGQGGLLRGPRGEGHRLRGCPRAHRLRGSALRSLAGFDSQMRRAFCLAIPRLASSSASSLLSV